MLGHALDSDIIVEPVRGKLIPGFRFGRRPLVLPVNASRAHVFIVEMLNLPVVPHPHSSTHATHV